MTDSVSRDRGRLVDANKAVMNKHTAPVYLDNIHTAPPIHAPSSVYANLLANATEHQANNKADSQKKQYIEHISDHSDPLA